MGTMSSNTLKYSGTFHLNSCTLELGYLYFGTLSVNTGKAVGYFMLGLFIFVLNSLILVLKLFFFGACVQFCP